ncbi:hypothetical protein Y11_33401 [Yersinia enterocolitica subsp. palearctica Y11]|uniref:Uncharacterized protein n=1 Tax=Yersinia enterocolitica subsp. palearctica serotype O:3 (strain DSM 13030 / CIP 106945 / Y11) TaxID=930944 RepID=A0A0H3NVZ6_YERE1|nr:hypothetical protein Y11_33401 [Yersinia enterocolitica subsp. palearctica Y11]CCO70829.1 hypothetical protein D322_3983 [Yersinia enterocolitica IP 10393]
MICESAREVSLQRKYQNQKLRYSAQKKDQSVDVDFTD